MKKTLLTVFAAAMLSTTAFSQTFTQATGNKGFTYDCELGSDPGFSWVSYSPVCDFSSENGGGGYDEAPVNELGYGWGQGSNGRFYVIFLLTTPLDLSGNPYVNVTLRNINKSNQTPLPMTYKFSLENAANEQLTDGTLTADVTGTKKDFSFDLTNHTASGKDLTAVKKIIFIYDGCPSGTIYGDATNNAVELFYSNFRAGSFVTGVEDELLSRISESAVYPNPATALVNVKLQLNTTSHVKVVVKDALGNAVKTLTEQTTNSIDQAFNVSDLSTGLYFISYQIEGAAVKTQKLLIN